MWYMHSVCELNLTSVGVHHHHHVVAVGKVAALVGCQLCPHTSTLFNVTQLLAVFLLQPSLHNSGTDQHGHHPTALLDITHSLTVLVL